MKFTWIKTKNRTPKKSKNFINLSENLLVKTHTNEYIEAYYHTKTKVWYNAENNKKMDFEPVEWCEVT